MTTEDCGQFDALIARAARALDALERQAGAGRIHRRDRLVGRSGRIARRAAAFHALSASFGKGSSR